MRVISNYISIAPLIPTYQVVIPLSKQSMQAMSPELPPGFRFHPTDEELIVYYLRNQAASRPSPASMIPEINIYSFDPWELPGKSDMCEGEWYFFSPRHRKYPNGARPNRATSSGYWKATGTDKAIYSGSRYVGVKKALVFYRGRPPKGAKTEWIMHEYRLGEHTSEPKRPNRSLGVLDEWVLCRIYKKRQQKRGTDDSRVSSPAQEQEPSMADFEEEEKKKIPALPRLFSLAHLLDSDYISASQIFDDHPLGTIDDLFDSSDGAIKLTGAQSSIFNIPPVFVDPIFQH